MQLRHPVKTKILCSKLKEGRSLCVHDKIVYVATSDGLIFIDISGRCEFKQKRVKHDLAHQLIMLGYDEIDMGETAAQLQQRIQAIIDDAKAMYANRGLQKNKVILEDVAIDSVCYDNSLYIACRSNKSIYRITLSYNGVGLTGTMLMLLQYPENVSHVSDIKVHNEQLVLVVPGETGAIFVEEDGIWTVILHASEDIHIHGIDFMGEIPVFTNTKKHKLQTIVDGEIRDFAGSGAEGSKDGPSTRCQFGQPAGIVIERNHSIFVVDTQMGTVRLLVDVGPSAQFCRNIGVLFQAFGMHKKGQPPVPVNLDDALELIQSVQRYIQETTSVVRAEIGTETTRDTMYSYTVV